MPLRVVNIIAGVWLFISAFIWPHTSAQRLNTWIIGALFVVFAAIAMSDARVRFVNTVLAVWLFFFTLAAPHMSSGTLWNNVIIAVIVFVLSLIPARMERVARQT